jgi:photosystem II stability/assembly factor-like uncharacterized protein
MRAATLLPLLGAAFCASCWAGTAAPCTIQKISTAGASIWMLCDRQEVYISSDNGRTWLNRRVPTDVELRTLVARDTQRAFIAGDAGTLLATTDGARTWTKVPVPTDDNLTTLTFVGEHGWIGGQAGVILHSSDAGRTWTAQSSGMAQGIEQIYFIDSANGWAVGWNAAILRTTDGGETWQRVEGPGSLYSVDSVYFRDANTGWAVGFGGRVIRSRDGGRTWQEQTSPVRDWLKSVTFDAAGRGWITGDNAILVSADQGETWKTIPVNVALFLSQVTPVNGAMWAVGQYGILRQTPGQTDFTQLDTLPDSKTAGS